MKPRFLTLSLCAVPLIACTGGERAQSGECPAGEICSPDTPRGLHFVGEDVTGQLLLTGPAATAIGGTQDVQIQIDRGSGLAPFDLPFEADDDGARGFMVDGIDGNVVTLRGTGSRTHYLRIIDPATGDLYDRKELAGAAISRIALVGAGYETLPAGDPDLVWAPGNQTIAVALYGEVQRGNSPQEERLVDNSMSIVLAGALRSSWDAIRLPSAMAGTSTVTVTAGDKPAASLTVEIVSAPTEVTVIGSASRTVAPGATEMICFAGMHGQRYVYGLDWTFVVDGQSTTKQHGDIGSNCIGVSTTKTSGTVAVQATAGGQSTSLNVNVLGTSTRTLAPARTLLRTEHTAGDRAAADLGL